jgi:hypothetical protein
LRSWLVVVSAQTPVIKVLTLKTLGALDKGSRS